MNQPALAGVQVWEQAAYRVCAVQRSLAWARRIRRFRYVAGGAVDGESSRRRNPYHPASFIGDQQPAASQGDRHRVCVFRSKWATDSSAMWATIPVGSESSVPVGSGSTLPA